MTHDELVERVARAQCVANQWDPDDLYWAEDGTHDTPRWRLFIDDARAAIAVIAEVMREPLEEMRTAAERGWSNYTSTAVSAYLDMLGASPLYQADETAKTEPRS